MEDDYERARAEIEASFIKLLGDGCGCMETMLGAGDLIMQVILENYQSEAIAQKFLKRIGRQIPVWRRKNVQ
jgi:hypothetical protein